MFKNHKNNLYNILLTLSRNIFFYKNIELHDTFETRIYLMFFHFSILMIVTKKKGEKFDQGQYDLFFKKIEYNLRELGFGDVAVNSKMKQMNKILYDILLKLETKNDAKSNIFSLNESTIKKYFNTLIGDEKTKLNDFKAYFLGFFDFCFELQPKNMLKEIIKFKY